MKQGAQGIRGVAGPQGPKGDQGESGSVGSVGSVVLYRSTTITATPFAMDIPGNPGVSLSVKRSGTSFEYNLVANGNIPNRYLDWEVINSNGTSSVSREAKTGVIGVGGSYTVCTLPGAGMRKLEISVKDWGDRNFIFITALQHSRSGDTNLQLLVKMEAIKY